MSQSTRFLQDDSSSPVPTPLPPQHIARCQHCNQVIHFQDEFFYLQPCKHCGKHTHRSYRFSKHKTPTREKIHLGWISS